MVVEIFQDAGLDKGTQIFLLEALQNAPEVDWLDILEPFLPEPLLLFALQAAHSTSLPEAAKEIEAAQRGLCKEFSWPPQNEHDLSSGRGETFFLSTADLDSLARQCYHLGFSCMSSSVFFSPSDGITIELHVGEGLYVLIDSRSKDKVDQFLDRYMDEHGLVDVIDALLTWHRMAGDDISVASSSGEEEGLEDLGAKFEGFNANFLPTCAELSVDIGRSLQIVTWGFFKLDRPPTSDPLINCSSKKFHYLTRNNKHIKKLNGLHDVVQGRICRNTYFPVWLEQAISRIEKGNLLNVSLCCAKGTHLSVAIAEMMKKAYYPNATVRHLTLAQNRPGHAGGASRH